MKINPKLLKVWNVLKNKYVIVFVLFVLLMLFSKETNIFYYRHLDKQINKLEKDKEFYTNQIKRDSINMMKIKKNINEAERFGREKYLMKRDNEDIFIIRHAEDSSYQNTIN